MADPPPSISRSSDSSHSSLRPAPLNFSRPRPQGFNSSNQLKRDQETNNPVRAISAFHEPARELPSEPRFSIDDSPHPDSASPNSASSEFAWDGQLGELRSKRTAHEDRQRFDRQRSGTSAISDTSASKRPLLKSNSNSNGHHGSSARNDSFSLTTNGGTTSPAPAPAPENTAPGLSSLNSHILKRVSFDQQSERMSISTARESSREEWEDVASHHTVSDDGESRHYDQDGPWQSSDHDISGLTEAEIRKLRKKGINPALYVEMKAARKGKGKWIGPLVGNTFIG